MEEEVTAPAPVAEQDISAVVKYGRIPNVLWRDVKVAAAQEGMSLRQFVVQALAEKLNKE